MLAWQLAQEHGRAAFTLDPTNVDEYDDVARITGIKGVYRRAQSHVLNQKGIARIHAAKLGRSYEECSFIVCHITEARGREARAPSRRPDWEASLSWRPYAACRSTAPARSRPCAPAQAAS